MKLATTTGFFLGDSKDSAGAVRLFEGTGFKYLDYNFYSVIFEGSPFLENNWLDDVEAAGREAERLGFSFVHAHSPNYNPLDPKADHERGILATNRSIEACGRLGIKTIVVHSGFSLDYKYPQDRDGYFRINKEFYQKLIPAMEKWEVNVLIENSAEGNMGERYFFMTGEDMRDFAEYFNHPLLHCNWDIGHANMRNNDQYLDILAMGDHLRGLHIQDNFGKADEHLAPFVGTTDMDAVMQGLLKVDYKGYFTFEADNIILSRSHFPHGGRKKSPSITDRRLALPPIEIKQKAISFLYEIGKSILSAYDCFEE